MANSSLSVSTRQYRGQILAALVVAGAASALSSATEVPAPPKPPVHIKFQHVIVGPERGKVVTVVCWSVTGKVIDAYLTMSTGDDDVDTKALDIAKAQPYKPLIIAGKPVESCRERVIVMPMPPVGVVTVESVQPP